MWVEFEINGKKNFLLFEVSDGNDVDCVLYNGKDSWHEKQKLNIIMKRAKDLNKRLLQLDEATIKEILEKEKPVEANWIGDGPNCSKDNEYSLKLKYRLESYPFNFTWHFNKQTEHDFQQFILFPLFRIVQGLTQQNEELREIVRKKDREIKQYKTEGAILKIVTVATPTFNFTKFDEKYADSIALTKRIMQISELLKAQYEPMQTPVKSKANAQGDNKNNNETSYDVKLTPRRRRRKQLEEQERRHAEKIKLCAKTLEYENSQSEQQLTSSSEVSDVEESKKPTISPAKKPKIDHLNNVKDKIENTQFSTPKKCTSAQKYPSKSPNECIRSLRKRKPNDYVEHEESQNSTDNSEDVISNAKTNEEKPNKTPTQIVCQLNTTSDIVSDDIKSIIDEWKALEERRVADLKNIRTTRTGKRISY